MLQWHIAALLFLKFCIGSKGNRTQPYWQHKDHSGIHILQPSMFSQSHGQMIVSYYKQPWTHSAAHSLMTIILYWLYPQATPEQKPLCQRKYQSTYWRWNALKKKTTRGPLRFSVHIREPVTDVVHMAMSLADVSMICPIRDVSELAFLQVSQKSAQFFKAFLVLCGSTSAEQEL